jgi:hypothetical protein
MTRLDTIRTYFIERFFEALTNDPQFAGLTEPIELFAPDGRFDVSATPAGFRRIPTAATLRTRISAATDPKQKEHLEQFLHVLERTLGTFFGLLGHPYDLETLMGIAEQYSPVVRHPDSQTYWPVDIIRYLGFDDGVLRGRLHSANGTQPIGQEAFRVLFDNPDAWEAPRGEDSPRGGRRPFTSTIGIDSGANPYPASPLTAGHLDLPAGDARLTPGRLRPTLFVEIKSLAAASRLNRHYNATAARGGRFAELRNNRVHDDPVREADLPPDIELLMMLYHAFYPADDGARRLADGTANNREFHHLAVGLLMPHFPERGEGREALSALGTDRSSALLFVSTSPTTAGMVSLQHPSLKFVDGDGKENPEGFHPVLFANTLGVQGIEFSTLEINTDPTKEGVKDALDYDPDSWEWWVGLGTAVGLGALAGAIAGPIGAVVGAAIGLLVFLLAWALKKLFGGNKDRQREWTEQEPWPGDTVLREEYRGLQTQDIGPPGVVSETGGTMPGRSYALRNIPHFPNDNLYGLDFSGGDTFRIVDDAERREMLAWRAFTGGVGYQFERPAPGRADTAGASLRNYFDLFIGKYQDWVAANNKVVYFGAT